MRSPVISGGGLVAVSLRTGGATATGESLLWTMRYFRSESDLLRTLPLWRNYRAQVALLLALTAYVVVVFR